MEIWNIHFSLTLSDWGFLFRLVDVENPVVRQVEVHLLPNSPSTHPCPQTNATQAQKAAVQAAHNKESRRPSPCNF